MEWTRMESPLVWKLPNSTKRVLPGIWTSRPGVRRTKSTTATNTGPQSAIVGCGNELRKTKGFKGWAYSGWEKDKGMVDGWVGKAKLTQSSYSDSHAHTTHFQFTAPLRNIFNPKKLFHSATANLQIRCRRWRNCDQLSRFKTLTSRSRQMLYVGLVRLCQLPLSYPHSDVSKL